MTKISRDEFKTKYNGSIDELSKRYAVAPKENKTLLNATETAETGHKKKRIYREYELQVQICKYLNLQYPKVIFESSFVSIGIGDLSNHKKKMLAAIQKKDFRPPDLKIYASRHGYFALAMELKAKSPYLKDGETLTANKHIQEQWQSICLLREQNWYAGFFWDFNMARTVLDWYLKEK